MLLFKKIKKKAEEATKKGLGVGEKAAKTGVESGKKTGEEGARLGKKGINETKKAVKKVKKNRNSWLSTSYVAFLYFLLAHLDSVQW